ncbi:MAG: nucleotidyltransferase family protein [Planctomycetaceae bacterium]|nr:nucleotidyltransferase family protein [Planctomycetaceae bacterium]
MTVTRDSIVQELAGLRDELARRYTVRRIGVFGSVARNEAAESSDIDLLVELEQPTFDHYMDLKFSLEAHFGREVDLVLMDTLKPRLKPLIERDVVYA